MDTLSYIHLEAAIQELPVQIQETIGNSWDSQVWEEIFEEVEEEDGKTTD